MTTFKIKPCIGKLWDSLGKKHYFVLNGMTGTDSPLNGYILSVSGPDGIKQSIGELNERRKALGLSEITIE